MTLKKKNTWFAQLLKAQRALAKFTQARLAEQLGVTEETVKAWESGSKFPGLQRILDLSRALKAEPAVFFPTDRRLPALPRRATMLRVSNFGKSTAA